MLKKGAVVLVPFPFTNLSGSKVRPALIVSVTRSGNDVIVVFITSRTKRTEKYLVSVAPNNQNGIKVKSKVICGKLATLDAKIILGELGAVSAATQKRVDVQLRKVLGL